MTFGATFGRVFSPTFQPNSQSSAAAVPWYLSGGIAAANCIAAYQPKGAASQEASYANLANAGVFTAYASIPASASWSAANGWYGDTVYLSDIEITNSYYLSIIARYSNVSTTSGRTVTAYNAGTYSERDDINIYARYTDGKSYFRGYNATGVSQTFSDIDTTYCVIPGAGYFNGSQVGSPFSAGSKVAIGRLRLSNNYCYCKAVAVYNITLSGAQITALTTAMNAL